MAMILVFLLGFILLGCALVLMMAVVSHYEAEREIKQLAARQRAARQWAARRVPVLRGAGSSRR